MKPCYATKLVRITRLRHMRETMHLSVEEFAKLYGISADDLIALEERRYRLCIDELAAKLHVSPVSALFETVALESRLV